MRILAGVPRGGHQTTGGCRRRQFSAFSAAISLETTRWICTVYRIMQLLVGLSVIPKRMILIGPEWPFHINFWFACLCEIFDAFRSPAKISTGECFSSHLMRKHVRWWQAITQLQLTFAVEFPSHSSIPDWKQIESSLLVFFQSFTFVHSTPTFTHSVYYYHYAGAWRWTGPPRPPVDVKQESLANAREARECATALVYSTQLTKSAPT